MVDDLCFRRESDPSLELLKQSLIKAEADGDFEAEGQNGVLNILFEETGGKFVLTPNTPVRQIWISALSTSFKLDWDETVNDVCAIEDRRRSTCTHREVVAAAYRK